MKNTHRMLRAGVALHALALVGATTSVIALTAPAHAQDYTSGAIQGTVTDQNGAPVSGATVTVTSTAQGTVRTGTTSSSGSVRINNLPVGTYNVVVESGGKPGWRAEGVSILASQTVALNIALSASEEIVVTGSVATRAFTGTTTGINVDVADFIKTNPLGRDLTSVVLLAPGTSRGDSAFGNLASIGGSSVAENAYYINGLNTTNFDTYLGSASVPFYFYRNVEVKSGGYPAEFGRATGGIVNAVTKSGSNDFTAAVHIDWSPNFLRSRSKDLLSWDGSKYVKSTSRADDKADTYIAALEAGGPIIKDRLFVYGLVQFQRSTSLSNAPISNVAYSYKNDDPFWGAKIDAYPIDNHHLEFTIFDTRNTQTRSDLAYSNATGQAVYGGASTVTDTHGGGLNYVGKYTGQFTDWLTLSAAYGRVRDRGDSVATAGDTSSPVFINSSGATVYGVANGGYFTGQRNASVVTPYTTERLFYRADADLLFSILGDHHVRFGYDQENNTLAHTTVRSGGSVLNAAGFITPDAFNANTGNAGLQLIARAADSIGPIVELNYYNTGGVFKARNRAFYIQDEWKVTDRLTINYGARRDDFRVNKPDGSKFGDLSGNYSPRIGVTYNLWGDKSGKIFGSFGTYYLPFASNTAFRQGGREYYFRERWHFSGVDSKGLPILTTQVTNQGTYQTACPFKLTPKSSGQNCAVTGTGEVLDTTAGIAANLKATKETEWILGYEQQLGRWTVGLAYTHRNLNNTAEDMAIDAAVNAYCTANGIKGCDKIWTGYHQYVITNPGSDLTVNLAGLDNRKVTLTAAQLGYPKAKRTYDAVDLTFRRKWDGNYSVGGSYTWSKSLGNSEGFVQSDFGQSDAGITQDFDQPGFTEYSYGYLPNDVRHRFKVWGSVALSDAFSVGSNITVQSPRSLSCFGYHPTDLFADGYGAASHYCNGQPSPRGSAQKGQWNQSIDLSLRYNVKFGERTVTLRGDVFNLLNSQAILKRNETGDLDVVTSPTTGLPTSYIKNPSYGLPTSYQSPRYVRLGLDIAF